MAGMLKTFLVIIVMMAGFATAINAFGSAWPAWLLTLVGFVGGNVIVALSAVVFVREWSL